MNMAEIGTYPLSKIMNAEKLEPEQGHSKPCALVVAPGISSDIVQKFLEYLFKDSLKLSIFRAEFHPELVMMEGGTRKTGTIGATSKGIPFQPIYLLPPDMAQEFTGGIDTINLIDESLIMHSYWPSEAERVLKLGIGA
jgi:hypothetical protein